MFPLSLPLGKLGQPIPIPIPGNDRVSPLKSNFHSNSKSARRRSSRRLLHHRVFCNYQLPPDVAPLTSEVYGLLLLSGGIFAFTKSGSKGSLFGGLTGAALMASVYFLMQAPETRPIGDALGFGSAILFSSVFGIRLAATRKFVPAGPLLGVSILALVVFVSAYLRDNV